jgi:hypothetical protein
MFIKEIWGVDTKYNREDMLDELRKCDRCAVEYLGDDSDYEIRYEIWNRNIFYGVGKTFLPENDLCKKCAVEITPLIYRLRDIYELQTFTNKLQKAIYDKRKQQRDSNNWATSDNVSERRKGCIERRLGYRQSYSTSQTCEEHF